MANVDLPNYLKRSKTLNNLTVRRLLKYWAVVCSFAVILLSLAAVITNDIVSKKQEKLNNIAIPIEENSRNLGHVLIAFEKRQQDLLAAKSLEALKINLDRSTLEQRFREYTHQLDLRIEGLDNAKPIITDIEKNYLKLLELDSKLSTYLISKYENSQELDLYELMH